MKRLGEYFLLVILITFCVIKGIIPGWSEVHSDFANYYVSAKLVVEHDQTERLYDNEWFQQKIKEHGIATQGKFAPFPPITAWMMVPLTPFSPMTAQRIFLLINVAFIFIGTNLLKKVTGLESIQCAILLLAAGAGLSNNLAFGQVYLIMTVFILFAIVLVKNNYARLAGIILSIFTAIKYFPAVLVGGYFLNSARTVFSRKYRSPDAIVTLSAVITGILIGLAEIIFFGKEVISQFISSVFIPHLDGVLTGQGLYTFHYQSWTNFFRNVFVSDPEYNPTPMIDWTNGKFFFTLLIILLFTASTIGILLKYKKSDILIRRSVYLSILSLAALALLPASATYHFILLLIPVSLIIGDKLISQNLLIVTVALYTLIGFIPYGLAFQLGKSTNLLLGYPRLWLVSGIYFVVAYGLYTGKQSTAS